MSEVISLEHVKAARAAAKNDEYWAAREDGRHDSISESIRSDFEAIVDGSPSRRFAIAINVAAGMEAGIETGILLRYLYELNTQPERTLARLPSTPPDSDVVDALFVHFDSVVGYLSEYAADYAILGPEADLSRSHRAVEICLWDIVARHEARGC